MYAPEDYADMWEEVLLLSFEQRAHALSKNQKLFAAQMLSTGLHADNYLIPHLMKSLDQSCFPHAFTPALQAVDNICKVRAGELHDHDSRIVLTSFELLRALGQIDDLMKALNYLDSVCRELERACIRIFRAPKSSPA